jgi:ornithine carbamoyltransferase
LKGLKLCYVGDGRNNVARSLLVISAKLGIDITIVSPASLHSDRELLDECAVWAKESGATVTVTDKLDAVTGADALYTDVWVSMGEEARSDERHTVLGPYQVNGKLMKMTGKSSTVFLHCLPAVKGEEVSVEVIEGPQSRVWDQAENRKHTIKAIMLATL